MVEKKKKSGPGRKKGTTKTGGRKKGTPNKRTVDVMNRLNDLGCDPIALLVETSHGMIDCRHCDEQGKVSVDQYFLITRTSMPDEFAEMPPEVRLNTVLECPYCRGTKMRALDDTLTVRARTELLQYIAPKRKAIEVTGELELSHEDALKELQ